MIVCEYNISKGWLDEMNLVQELRSRRREKYGEADIREFTAMFKEGYTNKIPPDIAPFLVKHVPQNDDG